MNIFILIAAILSSYVYTNPQVLPLITPRSSSTNLAREMVEVYHTDADKQTSRIFAVPEIIKSFHPEDIATTLFGTLVCAPRAHPASTTHCAKQKCDTHTRSCKRSFKVSGSSVANRTQTDWLADYCGLPTDFESIVSVQPHYVSALVDLGTYLSLDRFIPHSYIFVHMPVEKSWWNLHVCETIIQQGQNNYTAGYFDTAAVPRDHLVDSFSAFAQGAQVPQFEATMYKPLEHAKMSSCARSLVGIADAEIILGCHPIDTRDYTYGIALRASIPAGHTPEGEYLFEPMIGTSNHYKLGLELNGHLLLWHNEHNDESATFGAALVINHLFGTAQHRTFDLCGKPLSRYMLAQQVDSDTVDNLQAFQNGNFVKPAYIFAKVFEPVANLTTLKVDSKVSIECEFSCMFSFSRDQFTWHIGYDFWVQSREKLKLSCCKLSQEQWALKGDAQVFGFLAAADGSLPQDAPIALSATQSQATITQGTNAAAATSTVVAAQNPGIDSAAPATAGGSNTRLLYAPGLADSSANQINTSATPVLITVDDLDIEGARISHKANKLFMHMQYTVPHKKVLTPTLGLGAEVDFGTASCDPVAYTCSFWGLWVYIGGLF